MKQLKTNFSLPILVIVLMLSVLLVGADQARASVTYAQDTTWNADVGNITIEVNSTAGLQLSNNGGHSYTCDETGSHLSVNSTTTQTFNLTPLSTTCSSGGGSSSGDTASSTPTPTPTPLGGGSGGGGETTPASTPAPTTTPTPTSTPPAVSVSKPTPASRGFINLAAVSLKDGDVVSAAGSSDPDVYIVNPHGYKRLFLNPAIF